MEYDEKFFEWLRSINKLDKYEAALDISEDYAGDQEHRLEASEFLDKLRIEYKKTK